MSMLIVGRDRVLRAAGSVVLAADSQLFQDSYQPLEQGVSLLFDLVKKISEVFEYLVIAAAGCGAAIVIGRIENRFGLDPQLDGVRRRHLHRGAGRGAAGQMRPH